MAQTGVSAFLTSRLEKTNFLIRGFFDVTQVKYSSGKRLLIIGFSTSAVDFNTFLESIFHPPLSLRV